MVRLKLAQALKKRKISKRQFAKHLGISYHNVFRYFHEGYDPKLSTLFKWASVLKVKIRDLFEEPNK